MTLRFSESGDEHALKALWKTVFDDPEKVIEAFFSALYVPGSAAVVEEDGSIVSAAYIVPFGTARYIYAVGTDPRYRSRGFGKAVTLFAAGKQGAYLSPAEPSLFAWYEKMGATVAARRTLRRPSSPHPISVTEYQSRREEMLRGIPHAVYSEEILRFFAVTGSFFADAAGIYAIDGDSLCESLPPITDGEAYLLALNGAPALYWGLTLG